MNKKYLVWGIAAAVTLTVSASYAEDRGAAAYDKGYTQERFHKADSDGDGALTLKEAGAASKEFEGTKGKERFNAADTNNDGLLTLEEASARKAKESEHLGGAAGKKQKRFYNKERFDAADTDGDGYLSKAEAGADKGVADVLGGSRFDAADTDGDGKMSFDEAKARYAAEREKF